MGKTPGSDNCTLDVACRVKSLSNAFLLLFFIRKFYKYIHRGTFCSISIINQCNISNLFAKGIKDFYFLKYPMKFWDWK